MSSTGTSMLWGRGKPGENLWGFRPIGGISPTYSPTHGVYFNQSSIVLVWGQIQNANLYQVEVALTPDFTGTMIYNSTVNVRVANYIDSSTNDARRYWRIRGSSNGGTNYGKWSEVGSYWLNSSGAQSITIPRTSWALINPNDLTDYTIFSDFPTYSTRQSNIYRVRERNRLGTMLTEYVTLKGSIQFNFDQSMYLGIDGFHEVRRFNEEVKTFFLAMYNDTTLFFPTPHIWKVQFESDPDMSMLAAGRQDLYVGTLNFTEV